MEEIQNLISDLQEIIQRGEERMITAVRQHQNRVLAALIDEANGLETRRDGTLKPNRANRRKLAKLKSTLVEVAESQSYYTEIRRFKQTFEKLEAINAAYFSEEFSSFQRFLTQDMRDAALARVEDTMIVNALNAGLKQPITEIIDSYLQGGNLNELKQTFRDNIPTSFVEQDGVLGVDRAGYLEANTGRYVRDSLNQFNRAMSGAMANATGAEWFFYSGSLVSDSRKFCEDRAGKFWYVEEVRSWAKLRWQGRNYATTSDNIFQLLGGYNCRHQLLAVSENRVPDSAISRAIAAGLYTP